MNAGEIIYKVLIGIFIGVAILSACIILTKIVVRTALNEIDEFLKLKFNNHKQTKTENHG